jgi:hypothetical protein
MTGTLLAGYYFRLCKIHAKFVVGCQNFVSGKIDATLITLQLAKSWKLPYKEIARILQVAK